MLQENIEEVSSNNVDANLNTANDMVVEMIGVETLLPELSSKEAFICTSLVEEACNREKASKKALLIDT